MSHSINYRASDIPLSNSAYSAMCKTNREIDKTIDVLTSKVRITEAADDAAGLSQSERTRAEISGLDRALQNTQDGISMLQTASNGITDIYDIVQHLRELAAESTSDTLIQEDRAMLQKEFDIVREEINRIANTTQFNGKNLLNGNASATWGSTDLSTRVIVNGSISSVGEDGEIFSAAGDYDISIAAKAGTAEVQKTGLLVVRDTDSIAEPESTLRELSNFYTDDDKFILDSPQSLTIIQGDGRTAGLTLYADDAVDSAAQKINNAIAEGLGQAKYLGQAEGRDNFAVFVDGEGSGSCDSESVAGTIVVRSAVTGSAGTLKFSGSEELLHALALNTIQEASENEFTVNITKSGTDERVLADQRITGNRISGAVTENIDVAFDKMAGISAGWDKNAKRFTHSEYTHETTIRLKDNTTNIQVGARENEVVRFTVADVTTNALKLDDIHILDRESAGRAITVLDAATDKVAMQNAKVGAVMSRLERSKDVISTINEYATQTESRLRDADMAKAFMQFTKLQIRLNAEQSVYAQANQSAQSVLSFFR